MKTYLKCGLPFWATEKIFQSRLPKTVLNSIFFTFLSYWETPEMCLVTEDFTKKNCIKELCKKSFENILK